jgi:hypothetical protein
MARRSTRAIWHFGGLGIIVVAIALGCGGGSPSNNNSVAPPPSATSSPQNNTQPQAFPIALGTSGGNVKDLTTSGKTETCCSGTLGSLVTIGGQQFILSNSHVLARSGAAKAGDPIIQPGLADVNCNPAAAKQVASFTRGAPLKTSNVDAALAAVLPGAVDPSGTIIDINSVADTNAPPASTPLPATVGLGVAKSGAGSGLTCGSVNSINTDVQVSYSTQCSGGTSFNVTFKNQVMVGGSSFSKSGDSGSLIISTNTAQPVALLYAGSNTGTVGNPIMDVMGALGLSSIVGGATHGVDCPVTNTSATTTVPLSASEVTAAQTVKDSHASELMAVPGVVGVGVGASNDSPGQAAIVIYVDPQRLRTRLPMQIDGVRTRIVPSGEFHALGATTTVAAVPAPAEVQRALRVKEQHASELLARGGIYAVGIGSSADDVGHTVITLFVDPQVPLSTIPQQLDDVRTRIYRSQPFRAFGWNTTQPRSCKLQR